MKKFLTSPKTHVILFIVMYGVAACSNHTTDESQRKLQSDIYEIKLSDGTQCVVAETPYGKSTSIQCNFK